jgi:hypothetical protein
MMLYQIDPTQDARWSGFVERHPNSSVFHTSAWLEALQRTYGYKPVVFTTSPLTGELANGFPFCYVHSWLTGGRLISLPFSDYCDPLFDSSQELHFVMEYLQAGLQHRDWRYIELRPIDGGFCHDSRHVGFQPSEEFHLHCMDLRPSVEELFHNLHKDSAQRRIQRAERAGVIQVSGRSPKLLKDFYELMILTRGRQHLPPQPYVWFRNLVECMKENLEIKVGYKNDAPIAGILTLRFRDKVYYKYGCSDARFKQLGGMPLLLWKAVEEAKTVGARAFDLGRTECENKSLITFKDHWARSSTRIAYWRFPGRKIQPAWKLNVAKRVFACMPDRLLAATGRLLYRHIA